MPQVQAIRTFAVNANNLEQSEVFYTKVLAAKVAAIDICNKKKDGVAKS